MSTKMYDLAARERKEIPADLEDMMMYDKIGHMARCALRQSNAGVVTEEDWKRFIREIEAFGRLPMSCESKRYHVIISERAGEMLVQHVRILDCRQDYGWLI